MAIKDFDENLGAEIGVWKADDKKQKKWYQDRKKGIPAKIVHSDHRDTGLMPPVPGKPPKK